MVRPSASIVTTRNVGPPSWRGGPDSVLKVWVEVQQEVTGDGLHSPSLLFPRHPDDPSGVWVTRRVEPHKNSTRFFMSCGSSNSQTSSNVWIICPIVRLC